RGVMGGGPRSDARGSSETDGRVRETFGGLASLGLANAERFERSERQARIERGFYRIASLLGEPVSSAAAYEALAHAACEAFAASFGAVLMPANDRLELAGAHELEPGEAVAVAAPPGRARALPDG